MRHLRLLQYVDEVARAGSIRKAAERLNVTASAVNRRIMDLEEELDTELFERRPRGVRLTAAGETYLRYVRAQSADVERMRCRSKISRACAAALSGSPAARHWRPTSYQTRSPSIECAILKSRLKSPFSTTKGLCVRSLRTTSTS
jgi:DNA-binding transcriptional LysR family regulator